MESLVLDVGKNNPEREGVLMTIMYNSIFGHGAMLVFHLVEWIGRFAKSSEVVETGDSKDRLVFAVSAIPARHEVTCRSAEQEDHANTNKTQSIVLLTNKPSIAKYIKQLYQCGSYHIPI